MSLRKIFCAIDFSPTSDEALTVAARLASEHDAELVLAHVWYMPPAAFAGEYAYPAAAIHEALASSEASLAVAVATARALGARRVSSVVLDGQPWAATVKALEQSTDVELVVLGTHGRSGIARAFLGSFAEMVVRHAPCSVLAVPLTGAKPFRRLLCPVDFSSSSRYAVELAAQLARSADSAITLLHVVEPPRIHHETSGALDVDAEITSRLQTLLDRWAAETTANHRIVVTTEIRVGRPGSEIRDLIEHKGPFDLVAMGSRGLTGIQRIVLGSVAEMTMRHAHRAVLVARERRR